MMKKGIIFVPFMTGYGGTETVIHNLLYGEQKLLKPDYRLTVYSLGGSFNYDWAKGLDVRVKWISKHRLLRTLYYLICLPFVELKTIRRQRPDFIISTNPVMWYLAYISKKLLKRSIPVIAWYHYSLSNKPIKPLFLKHSDAFLAISSGISRQLIKTGYDSNQIFMVLNPVVGTQNLIPRPHNSTHFVYVGRLMLDGQKNLRELFNALKSVKGDWVLDLYGSVQDQDELQTYIEKCGIKDHLKFHGFVSDPWSNIKHATCLIMTSKYEGLPMVLCEAIKHGIYCISSDIETGPEDIINEDNGQLYQAGNEEQLSEILNEIVNGKQLPSNEVIQASAQKFDLTAYIQRFNTAIKKIMEGNNG